MWESLIGVAIIEVCKFKSFLHLFLVKTFQIMPFISQMYLMEGVCGQTKSFQSNLQLSRLPQFLYSICYEHSRFAGLIPFLLVKDRKTERYANLVSQKFCFSLIFRLNKRYFVSNFYLNNFCLFI